MANVAEGEIIVSIDDSQLQAILLQLNTVSTVSKTITKSGKSLDLVLPGINRELRILLGQIPGMRNMMQYYFWAKRLERGYKRGIKDGLVWTEALTSPSMILALAATVVTAIRLIERYLDRVERLEREYENMIRRARGWTHDQFVEAQREWEGYLRSLPR